MSVCVCVFVYVCVCVCVCVYLCSCLNKGRSIFIILRFHLHRLGSASFVPHPQNLTATVSECPECNEHYSDMDLCSLFDDSVGDFLCKFCAVPLEKKVDENAAKVNAVMTKWVPDTKA